MSNSAQRPAEYKDLFDLPDHMVGQIVNGVLHTHPRPTPPHAVAAATLGMDIGSPFRGGGYYKTDSE